MVEFMSSYYLIGLISILVMLIPTSNRLFYNFKLAICFSLLFVFGAFRYDFGLDYEPYVDFFNQIKEASEFGFEYDETERMEIGYTYLNFISPSFEFIIIISTGLACFAYFTLFSRYVPPKYGCLAMLLFYLSGQNTVFFIFSGIRNGMAVALLILSLPLIEKKRLIPYIGMTILAWSIHNSAIIIFILSYLLGYIKNINVTVSRWMIAIAVILVIIPFELLFGLSAWLVIASFDRYTSYIEIAENIARGASFLVSASNISIIILILTGLCKTKIDHKLSMIVIIGLMTCYMPLLGPLDMRLSMYFSGIMVAGAITAYSKIKDKIQKGVMLGLIIAYDAYAFFVVWLNNPYFSYQQIHNYVFELIKF